MRQDNSIKPTIKESTWQGEFAITFCAGGYEAIIIPNVGANVIVLKDVIRGLDLLRTPDTLEDLKSYPQEYGIPILFLPNRIADGSFETAGRKYQFPINSKHNNHIHGYLHQKPWEVTKMEVVSGDTAQVEVCFECNESTDYFAFFPHAFIVQLIYELSSKGLKKTISITNKSDLAMPLGFGYHTAFKIPFHADSRWENYRMKVSVGEKWVLNERVLPVGEPLPLTNTEEKYRSEGLCPLGEPMNTHYTAKPLTLEGKDFHGTIIEDPCKGIKLIYEVGERFRHWVLWNMDGKSAFVCPEPQTWAINAPNIPLPDSITGMQLIEPQDTWSESCVIYVTEL